MRGEDFSGFIDRNASRKYGAPPTASSPFDVAVIYNLGFLFDGKTLFVRLLCPFKPRRPQA